LGLKPPAKSAGVSLLSALHYKRELVAAGIEQNIRQFMTLMEGQVSEDGKFKSDVSL